MQHPFSKISIKHVLNVYLYIIHIYYSHKNIMLARFVGICRTLLNRFHRATELSGWCYQFPICIKENNKKYKKYTYI